MHEVIVSAAVAKSRGDGTGTRRRTIWRGTAREETVEFSRTPSYFDELPPEVAADPELIVRHFEPAEPVNEVEPSPAVVEGNDVAAMSYVELRKLAVELGCSVMGNAEALRQRVSKKLAEPPPVLTVGATPGADPAPVISGAPDDDPEDVA
jgi:hypothetical protein